MSKLCRNKYIIKLTTALFFDKYHPKADGTCALSLRVTYSRKKKYYHTGVTLTPQTYEKVTALRPRNEFKDIAIKLQAFESKAADILSVRVTYSGLEHAGIESACVAIDNVVSTLDRKAGTVDIGTTRFEEIKYLFDSNPALIANVMSGLYLEKSKVIFEGMVSTVHKWIEESKTTYVDNTEALQNLYNQVCFWVEEVAAKIDARDADKTTFLNDSSRLN